MQRIKVTKEKDSKWWHLESGIPVTKTGTNTHQPNGNRYAPVCAISHAHRRRDRWYFLSTVIACDCPAGSQCCSLQCVVFISSPLCQGCKHISHSEWHRERFKTKGRIRLQNYNVGCNRPLTKMKHLLKTGGCFIFVCTADGLDKINIY